MSLTRRTFVNGALTTTAALGLGLGVNRKVLGANEQLRVGVAGLNGRGVTLAQIFNTHADSRVVALCDVDREVLDRRHLEFADRSDHSIARYGDVRDMLERRDIDVIAIATPNHWHSLMTIWACQAGKDVYVEKPISHNIFEGRQAVAAASEYGRMVAHGTQSRTSPGMQDMIKFIRDGELGKVQYVIGTCYKQRDSIGKREEPLEIPGHINYDMWCGPAQKVDLYRPRLHYDWHWDYNTGDGDIGNQGVHQMDLARWFLGAETLPKRVLSIGGRVGYEDAGNTPNTQTTWFDFDEGPLLFEVRGHTKQLDDIKGGAPIGVLVQCENGYLVVSSYDAGRAYDNDGNTIKGFSGGANFVDGFLKAVRSRDESTIAATALDGHRSASLCHMANISHLLGEQANPDDIKQQISSKPVFTESYERMKAHLEANEVDINDEKLTLGAALEFDPTSERFIDNEAANEMTRGLVAPARQQFDVPTLAQA